jgi:hypothetical protein
MGFAFGATGIAQLQAWERAVVVPMDRPGRYQVNMSLVDKFGLTGGASAVVTVTWPTLLLALDARRAADGVRVIATFDEVGDDLVPYLWLYNVTAWTVASPNGTLLPHTCGQSSTCWLYNITAMGVYNITATVWLTADGWLGGSSNSSCSSCLHVASALYERAPLVVAAVATGVPGGIVIDCTGTTGGIPDLSDLKFGFVVLWPHSASAEAVFGSHGKALVTGLVLGEQLVRVGHAACVARQ